MPTAAIALGTGAAGTTAHQFCIFVHGLDVAAQPGTPGTLYGCNVDSVVITERYGEAPRAEFIVDDPLKTLTIERDDDVYICDHSGRANASGGRSTDDLFRGFVNVVIREADEGLGWRWRVSALGLEALLDRRRLTEGTIPALASMDSAIQQILSTCDRRISALSGDPNAITTRRDVIPAGNLINGSSSQLVAVPLAGKTYREAIADVLAVSRLPNPNFDLYTSYQLDIDVQGRARWGITSVNVEIAKLPIATIREGAGAPMTQAVPYDIEVIPDATGYVSRVYVQGVDAVSSGWVVDAASEAKWGRFEDYLFAANCTSAAMRDSIGAAFLNAKRPVIRVQFKLSDTHDRLIPTVADDTYGGWHVRQWSSITSDSGFWGATGAATGITGLLWEIVKRFQGGGAHMELELGFGGGRQSGGAVLATNLSDIRTQTKSAARLVGTLDEVAVRSKAGAPTDADFDVPRDGFIVLDTTNSSLWSRVNAVWRALGFGTPVVNVYAANTTWTKPANLLFAVVEVVGGGGQGGGSAATVAGQGSTGGGGGGGGYARKLILASAMSSDGTVVVGAGGSTGGAGANGQAGGNSSFAATGITTVQANGGAGGVAPGVSAATGTFGGGGNGGTVAVGTDVGVTGEDGANNAVSTGTPLSVGSGGRSVLGAGGRAGGSSNAPGSPGTAYGGGGGGSQTAGAAGVARAGAAGADGVVIVTEYYGP